MIAAVSKSTRFDDRCLTTRQLKAEMHQILYQLVNGHRGAETCIQSNTQSANVKCDVTALLIMLGK